MTYSVSVLKENLGQISFRSFGPEFKDGKRRDGIDEHLFIDYYFDYQSHKLRANCSRLSLSPSLRRVSVSDTSIIQRLAVRFLIFYLHKESITIRYAP